LYVFYIPINVAARSVANRNAWEYSLI
jgi:hypothetical protein